MIIQHTDGRRYQGVERDETVFYADGAPGRWTKRIDGIECRFSREDGWSEVPESRDVTGTIAIMSYRKSGDNRKLWIPSSGSAVILPEHYSGRKTQAVVLPEGWRDWSWEQVYEYAYDHEQHVLTIRREGGG